MRRYGLIDRKEEIQSRRKRERAKESEHEAGLAFLLTICERGPNEFVGMGLDS